MVLSNYDIKEKLFENSGTIIYKAADKGDPDRLLTIKLLKGGHLPEYKKGPVQPEDRTSQGPGRPVADHAFISH